MSAFVSPVPYDRSQVGVGIVHFGVGNFHRSHQAMYLDRLLRAWNTQEAAREWGICGVGILPSDRQMRDALRSQDLQYTLVERHPNGAAPALQIGSMVEYLYAPDELDAVLARLANPKTRIVSLTITEGGYNINDSTGEFDCANAAVVADALPAAKPATVFGIIVAGLRLRRERGTDPFTVMSCDNIEGNGHVARSSISAFARLTDPTFSDWILREVRFPNSMVDRITPATSDVDRAWVAESYATEDAWPVISESYSQWVLEDNFGLGRPTLDEAGVQLVDDVRPYELMKLRLLNASHQALAYAGILCGYEYAHQGASDSIISALLRAYMDREATPTLEPVPGTDLDAYKDAVIARFGNPYVRDTLARLATDASDRIPKFLVPVIRARRATGAATPLSAAVVASWAWYAERYFAGDPLPFRDRQEQAVRAAVTRAATDPVGFLHNRDWFGDLANDKGFTADYLEALDAFRSTDDPRRAVANLLQL
ncbi:mannitol dehydrogenase family protein [Phycicoccus sp. Soil802]|uniref:mannitol dehydrogenase family protein n=1 Tax=Phycicoccus sp. Soil802 TaxID=1736414 RepID=UPI0007032DD5|nr:mannitol dehydrogenase family protein [Phycicoccus sp. Soil802]KRF28434.1 mannitol dehydrogenase [Phycicoccus sp. Soil802]